MDATLRKLFFFLCLGVISTLPFARGTCYGDACNEEHTAATSHGLLGASSPTCAAKQYPQDGSKLQPVSAYLDLWQGLLFEPLAACCPSCGPGYVRTLWASYPTEYHPFQGAPLAFDEPCYITQELLPGSLLDLRWNGQSHELDKARPRYPLLLSQLVNSSLAENCSSLVLPCQLWEGP